MVYLTYRQAAARVRRDISTIKRWRRSGMPMGWDVRGRRVVDERVLLGWYRDRLNAWPIHQQRAVPTMPGLAPAHTRTREETLPARVHAPALADLPSPEVVLDRVLDHHSYFGVS